MTHTASVLLGQLPALRYQQAKSLTRVRTRTAQAASLGQLQERMGPGALVLVRAARKAATLLTVLAELLMSLAPQTGLHISPTAAAIPTRAVGNLLLGVTAAM